VKNPSFNATDRAGLQADLHGDAVFAQEREPASADQRIRVLDRGDDPGNARLDDASCTGAGASSWQHGSSVQ
jgi:hypothetical protein